MDVLGAADHLSTPAKAKASPEEDDATSFHTPATVKGMIPAGAPELRAMGNEALQEVCLPALAAALEQPPLSRKPV